MTSDSTLSGDVFGRQISRALIRLRTASPFFATLALFSDIQPRWDVPTAATDGQHIYVNPNFWAPLKPDEQVGLILHEVLHAALLHVLRRGAREAFRWNVAADIVVNGMISEQGEFTLPASAIRSPQLEHLSVEEVYEQLDGQAMTVELDLLDPQTGTDSPEGAAEREAIASHWRFALNQAQVIARMQGKMPAHLTRELEALDPSRLDWQAMLWRFLVRTPTDFQGFDRRFIGRGLYLEALEGESLRVNVAIDTSGSIGPQALQQFANEIEGILRAYPQTICDLYYADADIYGPYEITADRPLPKPRGGGGTDFRPFFEAIAAHGEREQQVCVYFTDGFGTFPDQAPFVPVLWVLTAGSIPSEQVPFGETVRFLKS